MSVFQVSHNPILEQSKLVSFVLNLNTLVIKTSPKRNTQHFPENSGGKSGWEGHEDDKGRTERRGLRRIKIHVLHFQ